MLFFSNKKIRCPYCLTENIYRKKIDNCESKGCKKELPSMYVEDYQLAPPFFVQMLGWSGVGKTVYLQALTMMLMHMNRFWPSGYAHTPLTEVTLEYERDIRKFISSGKMPKPTQMEIQDAYMMQLIGMERWGGRTLVLRDVAGEVFNELQFPLNYTPYLLHVPVTFLMISINDLADGSNKAMDDLMSSYISTLRKHDPNFLRSHRKVIVVLSKADLLDNQLPSELRNYLLDDPFGDAIQPRGSIEIYDSDRMEDYIRNLARVSDQVRNWICDPRYIYGASALNLLNKAKNNNIDLKFSIVTSTGRKVEGGTLLVNIAPKRVLDPYFWALDLQKVK